MIISVLGLDIASITISILLSTCAKLLARNKLPSTHLFIELSEYSIIDF